MSEAERNYDLVMPFVTVASKGGPHDDASFTAGYQMGLLDERLRSGRVPDTAMPIATDCVPQADLLAMRYGWRCVVQPRGDEAVDGWELVRFHAVEGGPWANGHVEITPGVWGQGDPAPRWMVPDGTRDVGYDGHHEIDAHLADGTVAFNGDEWPLTRARQVAACLMLAADAAEPDPDAPDHRSPEGVAG